MHDPRLEQLTSYVETRNSLLVFDFEAEGSRDGAGENGMDPSLPIDPSSMTETAFYVSSIGECRRLRPLWAGVRFSTAGGRSHAVSKVQRE